MRRIRRDGSRWPAGRVISFCGLGLGFAVIATMSSVGVYQPVMFYMRSVQTILLLLVVPLFLALGRPLTLIIGTVPRLGPRLDSAIKSRAARLATFPAITTFVLVLTPFLIYFTPWYAAGFRSGLVAQLTHLALLVPGLRFLLDAAAGRPGAEGIPVHRRALDYRRPKWSATLCSGSPSSPTTT